MARRHHNDKTQSVMAWMASERLYEEYLFFYGVILCFWAGVGFFAFGFELPGRSQPENLFYNFLLFLLLATAMALTPMWYRLIFGTQARLERRSREIWEQVEAIANDGKREAIKAHLANDGALPPRYLQKWCLIGLAWFALFELFFVSAWVKNGQLIWQPEWVNSIIVWVKNNTALPPIHLDNKLFFISFGSDSPLGKIFKTEQELLASPLGEMLLLFKFWRAMTFFPTLFMLFVVLGKMIDWLGLGQFRYFRVGRYWDHDRFSRFLLYSLFFVPLFVPGIFMAFFKDVEFTSAMAFNKYYWMSTFYLNMGYIFLMIGLTFLFTWILIFRDILVSLYRRIAR